MVKKLSAIDSGYSSSPADWRDFLGCWGMKFGAEHELPEVPVDGATQTDLSPSYRHFVQATGGRGWHLPGAKLRSGHSTAQLFPLQKVGLLKKTDPVTWKAWNTNRLNVEIADKDYYDYSRRQDLTKFRDEHLDSLILVGTLDQGAVIVLNPAERSKDGEWEVWYLSTRLAGALRFRSFAELMQMLYFADLRPENDLWSYSELELASSCAGKLRFSQR